MFIPRSPVDDDRTGTELDPSLSLPEPVLLDPQVADELLRIAREAVTTAATRQGERAATVEAGPSGVFKSLRMVSPATLAALSRPGAAFVTLTEHGSLRGCIGSLAADQPLGEAVASAGTSAAVHDPRFMPLTEHELPLIHIDVSVLGPAIPLDDLMAFRPGVDGIIVARDGRRALFLPEVATDQGWGVQEVLDAVCEKAGLDRHAWQSSHTRLFVFRTICVSEPEAPATRCSP